MVTTSLESALQIHLQPQQVLVSDLFEGDDLDAFLTFAPAGTREDDVAPTEVVTEFRRAYVGSWPTESDFISTWLGRARPVDDPLDRFLDYGKLGDALTQGATSPYRCHGRRPVHVFLSRAPHPGLPALVGATAPAGE